MLQLVQKITYAFIILITLSCANSNSQIPKDITYEVLTEKTRAGANTAEEIIKMNEAGIVNICNLEIKINKKVDEPVLRAIAKELKRNRKEFDKLWISYYLSTGSGLWAITNFTPELEVQIFGSTNKEDIRTNAATNVEGEIIGKWRSEKSLMGASLVLFKNKQGELTMKVTFKSGEEMVDKIDEKKSATGTIYTDNNTHGEYYLIESNGNLGMYGRNGKFDEAVRL